jgi:hypothetical protein
MRFDERPHPSRRRRASVGLGASYGFLRPPRRHEEEQRRFLDRLRTEPELQREYRNSLVIQLVMVGILVVALLGLIVQSLFFLRGMHAAAAVRALWVIPAVASLLWLIALRRFLALLADYRQMRDH